MSEGLLKGDGGNISKPGIVLLEIRKHGSKIVVGELLSIIFVGGRAGRESPIVHEADTAERLSKDVSLLIGRIEPIPVCTLRVVHSLLACLVSFDVLFHSSQDLPIQGSVFLFGDLPHLLQ
jgi:hypothetical protein